MARTAGPIVAAFVVLTGGGFAGRDARAADANLILNPTRTDVESPQHFALEFRIGPYRPEVDEDPALGGNTPFDRYHPGGGQNLLVGLEFDWQVLRIPHFGSFGPGFGISYTNWAGKTYDRNTGAETGDKTTLHIIPGYAVGVLRIDVLARETAVPLALYGKFGIGAALWTLAGPTGTVQRANPSSLEAEVAEGISPGYHVAGGVSFHLNTLDPEGARNVDTTYGINHSYLYFEVMRMAYNGLGSTPALYVGNTNWLAGLAFEF